MFTGIITNIGTVRARDETGEMRFTISCTYAHESISMGASIACSGTCLTVVDKGFSPEWGNWFAVEASQETLRLTTLGKWCEGTRINLERALCLGDELGGHLVTGHVDGIGTVSTKEMVGDSMMLVIDLPPALMPYVAQKGSLCVDGVSLTVNAVGKVSSNLNIIPHTIHATTLGTLEIGDEVNLEIDLIARYLQRILEQRKE